MANKENGTNKIKMKEECQSPDKKFNIRVVPLNKLLDPRRLETDNIRKIKKSDDIVLVSSDDGDEDKSLSNISVQKNKNKKLKVKIKNLKLSAIEVENFQILEDNIRSRLRTRERISSSSSVQSKNGELTKSNLLESRKLRRKQKLISVLFSDQDEITLETQTHQSCQNNVSSHTKENVNTTLETEHQSNAQKLQSSPADDLPNSKESDSKSNGKIDALQSSPADNLPNSKASDSKSNGKKDSLQSSPADNLPNSKESDPKSNGKIDALQSSPADNLPNSKASDSKSNGKKDSLQSSPADNLRNSKESDSKSNGKKDALQSSPADNLLNSKESDSKSNGKKDALQPSPADNLPNSNEFHSKSDNLDESCLSLTRQKKNVNYRTRYAKNTKKKSSENNSDKSQDLNLESRTERSERQKNVVIDSNCTIEGNQDLHLEDLKTSQDSQQKTTFETNCNNINNVEHKNLNADSSKRTNLELKKKENQDKLSTDGKNEKYNKKITPNGDLRKESQNTSLESPSNDFNITSKSLSLRMKKVKVNLKRIDLKKLQGQLGKTSNLEKTTAGNKRKEIVSTKNKNKAIGEQFCLSSSSESKKEEDDKISSSDDDGNSLVNKQNSEEDDDSDFDSIKPRKKMSRKFITLSDSSDEDNEQVNYIDANEDEDDSSSNTEVFVKRTTTTRSTRTRKPTKDDDFDYNNLDDSNNSDQDKYVDSDSSGGKKKKKAPKRKRIKNTSDSSDDDDDEPGGSNKKRKNIRKLLNKNELNVDTKRAAEIERERRKRIQERQRLYNSIYEKPENIELNELILDFDEETQEPLLKVDEGLLKKLKPHQAAGVKFMWDACFETIKESRETEGSGCILAHCMGLGKTLQVIALTHTLLTHAELTHVERALIITPLSTLTNWAREYHDWLRFCKDKNIEVYDMSKFKDKNLRTFKLNEWFEEGGVCIIGYDMYRILSNEKAKGLRKKQREALQKALVDPGPDIVICDEGHLLKNEKTSLSQAVTKIRSKRRIVLTGTPLQNNLKEYYCMIQFIKPNLLGTYKEYLNRFVNPITNGQYTDSTERDIRLMKHRSHILHKLLEGCIQRRDYSVLAPYLPPKQEYSVFVTMSDIQQKIYDYYMTKQRDYFTDINGKGAKLFQDFQNLRRIWTHPMCLRVNSDLAIKKKLLQETDEEGSLKDFVVQDSDEETSSSESDDSFDSDKTIDSDNKNKPRKTRARKNSDSDIEEVTIQANKEDPSEWWCQLVPKEEITNIFNSPKLVLLMKILSECEAIGDKLLLFSQSLQSLDVIEEFLSLIDRKKKGEAIEGNVGDFEGTWQPGIDYYRLDGSCSVENREAMCKEFNNVANLRARLFLISTRAGSLGINLVAANRVVIFDVSWNPSHDTQSIFRIYRFGQDRPCYIYRFIALGTMEQKVYERQVVKQSTAKRVIDEQQIGRHYNQNDLLELYTYELKPKETREVPILPKDRLFAELLANYEKLIFKYHEHDSLLENQESDNLSEEERKAAWDEYEIEKTRPPTQPYVYYNRQNYSFGNTPMNGPVTSNKIYGFRTDILLRLLNMKASVDNPSLNQTQILQMVPHYLQELYKQMNDDNPTMYKELLALHSQLEMPQGYLMNPLLYANQAPPDGGSGIAGNSIAARGPPTTSTEIVEID